MSLHKAEVLLVISPVGHHFSLPRWVFRRVDLCWSSQEGLRSLFFEGSIHILRLQWGIKKEAAFGQAKMPLNLHGMFFFQGHGKATPEWPQLFWSVPDQAGFQDQYAEDG